MKKFEKQDREKSDRRGPKRFTKRDSGSGDSNRGSRFGSRDSGSRDSGRGSRFGSRDSGSRDPDRSDRRSNSRADRPTPTEVTCDKCRKRCEVPFKPTSSKPVYCSDCFRKNERSDSRGKSNQFADDLAEINAKLDRVLKALEL